MITPEGVRDLNDKPGLLALAVESYTDVKTETREFRGLPFVVPGGRFNEMYGWDSYMESKLSFQYKIFGSSNMESRFRASQVCDVSPTSAFEMELGKLIEM